MRAFVLVVLLCGCREKALEDLKRVRDEVCACPSSKCGEEALKQVPQGDVKSDHRKQALAKEMLACMAKLYLKDRPVVDPDAEADAVDAGVPTSPGSADPASARKP